MTRNWNNWLEQGRPTLRRYYIPVDGYDNAPVNGFTYYCLCMENGEVLAAIEAKGTRQDAREGKEQLHQYITKIEAGKISVRLVF